MSITQQTKVWFKDEHPKESRNKFRVSKYYSDKEIWFFTFPISYFDLGKLAT